MATSPARTDRWKTLDFGPPQSGAKEPDQPVLVEYTQDQRVAVITLNRPHADNAITTAMGARLTEILETIAVRPAVRAVILTGAGHRAFSVGSDLRQRKDMTKEDWLRQRQDFDRTLYTVRQLRKPIFTAVNGIAYGGGCELAQSTDFIIASDNATFAQPEAMLGLAAGGGSPALLPRLLPPGKAMQMLMTGEPDQRAGSAPARDGQRALSSRPAHRCRSPDRSENREQLTDRSTGSQAGGPDGPGRADRASHRDHDGGALALRRPSRPGRGHQRVQRGPRARASRIPTTDAPRAKSRTQPDVPSCSRLGHTDNAVRPSCGVLKLPRANNDHGSTPADGQAA